MTPLVICQLEVNLICPLFLFHIQCVPYSFSQNTKRGEDNFQREAQTRMKLWYSWAEVLIN